MHKRYLVIHLTLVSISFPLSGILLGYRQDNEAFIKIQGFVLILVALLVSACLIHKEGACIID
jgi:uncharacterized membrane protein (DUF373 family)